MRRRFGRRFAQSHETFSIAHHVIGGENRDDRVRPGLRREFGGNRHRWPRITPDRLKNNARLALDLLQLLGDEKTIIVIGNDNRRFEHAVGKHFGHHLERGVRANERNELLRQAFPRLWPNPRSRAAAHDDRKDFHDFPLPREEYR